jgi:hypothetical protein
LPTPEDGAYQHTGIPEPTDDDRHAIMGLHAKKKNKYLAILALAITTILLLFTRHTTSWDLYNDVPFLHKEDGKPEGILVSTAKNVAVILDTRPLEKLVPLILHFSSVLGPQWPIHIFTSPLNEKAFSQSPSFVRQLNTGNMRFRELPDGLPADFEFHEPHLRSEFMTQAWLWETLAPAEYVFMFTADSMICSKSEKSLEDFFEYDFIGAPTGEKLGAETGISGGLSLRNRERMLEIAKNSNWEGEKKGEREPDGRSKANGEDGWFWKKLKLFPILGDGTIKSNLPDAETARRFSVGPVWEDEPFGYELVHVWNEDKMDDVLRWCPEYVISMFNMTV